MILDITSLRYLRRLVRVLNAQTDGFYTSTATFNVRCNRARVKNGVLECRSPATSPKWFIPSHNRFSDPYGEYLFARQKA